MFKFEPVLSTVVLVELIGAVITALVAFGLPITEDQRTSVIALASILGAIFLGGGVLMRNSVYSPASVEKLTSVAYPVVPSVPSVNPPITNAE